MAAFWNKKEDYSKQNIRVAVNRAELYAEYPKLYKIYDYIDMVIDDKIPTLGVMPLYDESNELIGKYELIWNPKFTDELSDKQLKGVLLHEGLHIVLDHTTSRCPEYSSKMIVGGKLAVKEDEDRVKAATWNIAGDLAINQMIRELLQDKDPKAKWHGGLFPENKELKLPANQNAEFYYKAIIDQKMKEYKDAKAMAEALEKLFKEMGIGSHGEWVETDKKTGQVTKGNSSGKQPIDIEGKEPGPGEETDKEKEEKTKSDIKVETGLDQFSREAHAGVGSSTSDKVDLKIGAQKKTPGWMKQTKHASVHGFTILPLLTRKIPNRRYGLQFPGKRRQQVGHKVLVAIDVSGSIDKPLYNDFCAHLNNLQRYAQFDIVFFNSSILDAEGKSYSNSNSEQAPRPFKRGMSCHIGGGTDFEPVITLYNKVRNKYDAIFIFTDGEANYQTPPVRPKEVNWIVYNSSPDYVKANCPHGNIHPMQRGEYK
jgi:predicted metal-dependent peptidase